MREDRILLGHGSGGRLTHNLIKEVILKRFDNPILKKLADSAILETSRKVAFTTDSFVVSPLFFPGGDIGKLAVCGTVNDLVMQGAVPEYLALALIIEEGLEKIILEKILDSISLEAKKAGVLVVTGDMKVVEKGACDKIFINSSGLGRVLTRKPFSLSELKAGDKVIVTGNIGQHGLCVLAKRKGLELGFSVKSDCAALNGLLLPIIKKNSGIKFMRDPTRGGLATTLKEISEGSQKGILIKEKYLPLERKLEAAAELLGIDPLYLANEGMAVVITQSREAGKILKQIKAHPLGRNASIIGEITDNFKGSLVMETVVGTERIVDMLTSQQLPRIC